MSLVLRHNAAMDAAISRHHGRLAKSMGDGYLVDFPPALDAARTAVEAQDDLHRASEGLADLERLRIRVRIHLCDVLEREGDLFGPGVTIARRLCDAAPAGGILVTRGVYENTRTQLTVPVEAIGPRPWS